jgi:hypothetical protein
MDMTEHEFSALFPIDSAKRHFAARLMSETRSAEATEAYIAHVAHECGVTEVEREVVINEALDRGLVRSTMLETRLCEVTRLRSVACLTATNARKLQAALDEALAVPQNQRVLAELAKR